MKIYQSTRQHESAHSIIEELNAIVNRACFPDKTGIQKGDLYNSPHTGPRVVNHNSCGPTTSTFVKTIEFKF